MDNYFNPSISVEKMAAYLDGNLEEKEMMEILNNTEDSSINDVIEMSDEIDQEVMTYQTDIFEIHPMDFSSLPVIPIHDNEDFWGSTSMELSNEIEMFAFPEITPEHDSLNTLATSLGESDEESTHDDSSESLDGTDESIFGNDEY